MSVITLINGPNLNLLGTREPDLYGSERLGEVIQRLETRASQAGHQFTHFQNNSEGALIDYIQEVQHTASIALFNPGAYTHTSLALRDAILAVRLPFVELHLTNLAKRESVRQHSHFTDLAIGLVSGFGVASYDLALEAALYYLASTTSSFRGIPHGHS
ncbi:MAG: type II 3-dehydroquinate dehydratase [Gammaproteobacteria bacterium]